MKVRLGNCAANLWCWSACFCNIEIDILQPEPIWVISHRLTQIDFLEIILVLCANILKDICLTIFCSFHWSYFQSLWVFKSVQMKDTPLLKFSNVTFQCFVVLCSIIILAHVSEAEIWKTWHIKLSLSLTVHEPVVAASKPQRPPGLVRAPQSAAYFLPVYVLLGLP